MKIEYQVDEFIEYCVEKGLSRSKNDIKQELKYFGKKGIRIKSIGLPTTLIDLHGN